MIRDLIAQCPIEPGRPAPPAGAGLLPMLRTGAIVASWLGGFGNTDGGVQRAWWTVIGQR